MSELKKGQFYLAADAVVFTVINHELKILLIQRKNDPFIGKYALPGGFVEIDETLEHAASRELEEETGVKGIFLKKLTPYGNPGRDPRGRVVSVPFLALIDSENIKLHASDDAALANWHSAYSLPELAFDHAAIIEDALAVLRSDIESTSIASQIMPEQFTLTELQKAYETILKKQLDKRNFRKKLKELNLLKAMPGYKLEGAHRPARLYSFRQQKSQ